MKGYILMSIENLYNYQLFIIAPCGAINFKKVGQLTALIAPLDEL